MCSCKIQLKERKLFLLITVDIPKAESVPVKGKVMGVDLGVVNPAYVAVNDGPERSRIGNGEAFQKQRDVFVEDFENYNVPNLRKVGMGESTRPKRLKFLEEKKETGYRLRITV